MFEWWWKIKKKEIIWNENEIKVNIYWPNFMDIPFNFHSFIIHYRPSRILKLIIRIYVMANQPPKTPPAASIDPPIIKKD